MECPDVLSQEEIESLMQTECMGRHVIYYEETDSTNTRIKHLAEQGKEHGTLAVADRQNSGKGRRGRAWEKYLYVSAFKTDDGAIQSPYADIGDGV